MMTNLIELHESSVENSETAIDPAFVRLIEEGQIDTRPWITHRSAFDRLADDFPAYTKPETGCIKAIVDVD